MHKPWQRYLAELFGTFVLVLVGTMAIVQAVASKDAGLVGVAVPLGFGLGLLAALYAFAEISGGHFNPAVTLAMFLDGRIKLFDAVCYWIVQFVGAIAASAALVALSSVTQVGFTANGGSGLDEGKAFLAEVLLTAVFLLVILKVTKSDKFGSSTLIAIGLTLAAVHFAGIAFSGASVNPARSLGPTLISDTNWDQIWIYLTAPLVGGALGWIVYKVTGDESFSTKSLVPGSTKKKK